MMTLYEIISIGLSLVAIGVAVIVVSKSTKTARRQEALLNKKQLQDTEAELARLQVEYEKVQTEHRHKKLTERPNVFSIEGIVSWEKELDNSYRLIYADYEKQIVTLKQRIRELKKSVDV
ncbi:MAG: hypothetical protein NC396_06195 [Bacteroides sp.]|nr:hypothetical protein [Bacteroides sp.]